MITSENSLTLVKLFLEADTKEELITMQIHNNFSHGFRFIYDSPIKDEGKWVVWYFGEFEGSLIANTIIEARNKSMKEGQIDVSS